MNKLPLVSVVLPVYNAEKFIKEALESVLNQDYKNFEVIVIDDGSSDNSLKILQHYASVDKRVRLFSRENKGLAKTLNEGIMHSKGKYIARMDADDICLPNRFSKQINYLMKHPEIKLLGGGLKLIDQEGLLCGYHVPYSGYKRLKKILFNQGCCFSHSAIMFEKKVALEFGGYNESIGKYFEDYFLWAQIANKYKVENLVDALIKYRITSESIMSSLGDKEREIQKIALNCVKKLEFTEDDNLAIKNVLSHKKTTTDAGKTRAVNTNKRFFNKFSLFSVKFLGVKKGFKFLNVIRNLKYYKV